MQLRLHVSAMTVCASGDLNLHQGPEAEREPVDRPGRQTSGHPEPPSLLKKPPCLERNASSGSTTVWHFNRD
jgi:hypothetical protein